MESEDRKPIFTKRLILIILAVILLILIIFLLLRKCGPGSGGGNYQVQNITLSPTSIGIEKGQNYPIYAYVVPEDAKDKSIIWSSSDETVATVDAAGLVTGVGEGTAIITATAGDGSGVTGQCVVTVGSSLPNLDQIQLNKSTYSVRVGKSVLVEVTPIPSTAQLTDVQYEIADTSVATVDNYGTIKGKKQGTTVLTVKANNGGVTATATVKVTKASSGGSTSGGTSQAPTTPTEVVVTGINLPSDGCYKLRVGSEYTLTASLVPVNATNQELKWESSDTSIATVTATGKVIASTRTGTVTIKATAKSGVYAKYEIRVVPRSTQEGSCTAGNNGSDGSHDNNSSHDNQVTTPNPGEINGDGVLTESTIKPEYNNKTYKLTVSGYIQSDTINKGVDGWMQNASCSISLNGILPPYYKATYQAPGGDETEFRTRAYVSDISGPVTVRVYIYDRLLENGAPNEIRNEYQTTTVCGKVNGHEIHIDNQVPSCDSISYNILSKSVTVTAQDAGGSGLHKITWENGKTSTFSGDNNTVTRNISSQYNAGTRKFIATIHDKAGNVNACGINVDDLNAEGTEITGTDLTSTLKEIKLSVGNSTLFLGSSTSITATGVYEDGTTADITDSVEINQGTASSILEMSGSTLTVSGDEDTIFGTSDRKSVTFSVHYDSIESNGVSVTILKTGRVSCNPVYQNGRTGRNGKWYTDEAGAVCSTDDPNTKITKIGACFASLHGTCTPSVRSVTAEPSVSVTYGEPTGQGKICVAYTTNKSSSVTTECFHNANFDNTAPTCTVSIDGSVFMYKIDDGNDSSGLHQLTGKNPAPLEYRANATTENFRYTGLNKPASTDKVSDYAGNTGNCSVPNFTEAQLQAMLDAAAEEDANGQIYIRTSDVIGEMWVCADDGISIEQCTSGYKLNSDSYQNFTASYTPSNEVPTTSILGVLKKFDDDEVNFEWSSTNNNVVALSATTGESVTGNFVGVGSSKITVCVAGTDNCASVTVTVSPIQISPKTLHAYHSGTMAVGTREAISVSVTPYGAMKDVTITSSDNSTVSVEGNVVVARKEGQATITVKSKYNESLVRNITINVIGKDTTKPEVSIRERQVNANIHVSFTAKDDSQVTLKYGMQKGDSCTPVTTSSTIGSSITETKVITAKGTYTACIEATDSSGNTTTYSKKIDANSLKDSGEISCSVSGTTGGTIRVGQPVRATISCTSNEKITVNSLNFEKSHIGASGTSSEVNANGYYRVLINVTVTGIWPGTDLKVALSSGALSTSTHTSPKITVGSYKVIDDAAPTLKSSCSISYDKSSSNLIASVTAENVQTMEYDTQNWASGSSSNTFKRKIDATKETKYTFGVKIYYKDGRPSETVSCSYTHAAPKVDSLLASPSITLNNSTLWNAPDGTIWAKGNSGGIRVNISLPSGVSTGKMCSSRGSSKCTPNRAFSGTDTALWGSDGTVTYCANYTLDYSQGYNADLRVSPTACKTFTVKSDFRQPLCEITLGNFTSGTKMNLTAKVTDEGSGLASAWSEGWTNNAEGYYTTTETVPSAGETKTITFTVKDKVGNQGTCSVKITGKRQCKSGYSEISGGASGDCYKYAKAPSYDWEQRGGGLYPAKPSRTNTETTRYESVQVDASQCYGQYGTYVTQCWKETVYSRGIPTCTGTYLINNKCYWRTSKIVVPTVTQ